MQNKFGIMPLMLIALLLLSTVLPAIAADRMTYEEYQSQLQTYQAREARANEGIKQNNQAIDELRAEIQSLTRQIEEVWAKIFAYLKITREQYEAFLAELGTMERRLSNLERLSPDQLLDRVDEIDELERKLNEMVLAPQAKISTPGNQIAAMQRRIDRLRAAVPKPRHDMYTVSRGDFLWRISGKQAVFGDPWKWMRLYSANRDQIKDPDLIYPDQRLIVPRQIDRGEYLVKKGEYLSKIAGYNEVYGDPFKWTKIYQANKADGFIQDANLIYPEQILTIP